VIDVQVPQPRPPGAQTLSDPFLEALDREAWDRWSQLGGEELVELVEPGREGDAFDLA
jgi:hypothetical protein